jgi:hypothetical protein
MAKGATILRGRRPASRCSLADRLVTGVDVKQAIALDHTSCDDEGGELAMQPEF